MMVNNKKLVKKYFKQRTKSLVTLFEIKTKMMMFWEDELGEEVIINITKDGEVTLIFNGDYRLVDTDIKYFCEEFQLKHLITYNATLYNHITNTTKNKQRLLFKVKKCISD